jgi:hypothetical protein
VTLPPFPTNRDYVRFKVGIGLVIIGTLLGSGVLALLAFGLKALLSMLS